MNSTKQTMLSGKTALVTGSTSGIGLGIARALAAEGANIIFNGFGDAAAIERLVQDIGRRVRRADGLQQCRHVESRPRSRP